MNFSSEFLHNGSQFSPVPSKMAAHHLKIRIALLRNGNFHLDLGNQYSPHASHIIMAFNRRGGELLMFENHEL